MQHNVSDVFSHVVFAIHTFPQSPVIHRYIVQIHYFIHESLCRNGLNMINKICQLDEGKKTANFITTITLLQLYY